MKNKKLSFISIITVLAVFTTLPLFGQGNDRAPINVNLIIDSSEALTDARDDITRWLSTRLDTILSNGDRVTVWSAGSSSRVIYTGIITGVAEKDAIKKAISDITPQGTTADFQSALRDAGSRQQSGFSYTLLISASPHSISNTGQLRFSRVEEFRNWRALVVGLNLEDRVRSASASFFGS